MIALYQEAGARAPESLPLAFALGRVYFERAMLDEAADQFQKVEVRAPDLPGLHATACEAEHASWVDRCPSCRNWNTSRP